MKQEHRIFVSHLLKVFTEKEIEKLIVGKF